MGGAEAGAGPDARGARDARELPLEFFDRDTVEVARDLLGKLLLAHDEDGVTGGIIVETEAYLGTGDPGSHAATKSITRRNEVLYRAPGTVYVYFVYGNYYLLNFVCGPVGRAGAVLIRALRPTEGLELMRERRGSVADSDLCSGPGRLAQALGIDLGDNRSMLGEGRLSVLEGEPVAADKIGTSGRVGLSEGHELELRYFILGDKYVSRGRTGERPPKRRR
ncbi:MAG: DNA-3-methyladenine glycosylase [Coriobacteriia bacterium]